MPREIKFRVWDGKYMWWLSSLSEMLGSAYEGTRLDYPEHLFLQFTGLKDKNGKEIYEGDIVSTGDFELADGKTDGVVKYFGETGYPAFDIEGNEMETNALSYLKEDGWVEVIGNIYENPELLTNK